ncbi:MAG TPA: FlgD immunoglobulin-like domain containing protein [Candidatus Bathyarchaeia archaeon]|nr:FlgD immunoglobulin-like domain containing protein [Candidatus Bathyarchaeia archaeon]
MKRPFLVLAVYAASVLAALSFAHAARSADAFTVTVYEQTGTIDAYTFQSTDPLLYQKRAGDPGPVDWGGSGYDFGTGGCEYYDLFFSDSLGNALALGPGDELPAPAYLTLICLDFSCTTGTIIPAPNWVSGGNNIDAVKISLGGVDHWANAVLEATYGLCDEPFSAKTSNFADAALGPQDGVITKMGCGYSALTLRFATPAPAPPPAADPKITSITDVGNDQGGKVRVKWRASRSDSLGSSKPITAYAIWRRIDANLLASRSPLLMYPPGEWDYVMSVPACCEKAYSTIVPTLADSTIVGGMHYSVFFVRALTATPGSYVDSPVDSGYSVDNLAPAPPEGIHGAQIANGLKITWAPSTDADFWHFILSRGLSENDSNPSVLATLTGTSYIDDTWTPQTNTCYYMLSAVDRSGNVGVCCKLAPSENVATRLQSFSLKTAGSQVELTWRLSACDENMGFVVLRAGDPGGTFEALPAEGLTRDGLDFVYRDAGCEPATSYRYRVECTNGSRTNELLETDRITTPAMPLTLHQNQPNPFNPSTTIRYYLPDRMRVVLDVFDVSGRLVARLVSKEQERGDKTVQWDGRGMSGDRVSSGVYYYRLQAGKESVSRKMVLLR